MRKMLCIVISLLFSTAGIAQLLPAEGSSLNYRIIGFKSPELQQDGMELVIASGTYFNADSFKRNVILNIKAGDKLVAEVPLFGCNYTWCISDGHNKKNYRNAVLHHFGTAATTLADNASVRMRILERAGKYEGAYVFIDGNRALYDMNGNPVWFLPAKGEFKGENEEMRDLRATPQGTITFLIQDRAYEVNYDGDVLWKGPNNGEVSGEPTENYHHEFKRLSNGHFMIMGNEFTFWQPTGGNKMKPVPGNKVKKDSLNYYRKMQMGTIIEYDHSGKVVWSWKSSEYFAGSDVFYCKSRNGRPEQAMHDNSFYFDEKKQELFVGFRNISRVIKVKYPEGKVLAVYGEICKADKPEVGNGLFCRQHSCSVSEDGNLCLFNNNVCNAPAPPTLIMMADEGNNTGKLKKVWEYQCFIESDYDTKLYDSQFVTGGNLTELPGGDVFCNMAGSYSKMFIVNRNKKVLWSALPEKWSAREKRWIPIYSYRCSMLKDKAQVADMIWTRTQK